MKNLANSSEWKIEYPDDIEKVFKKLQRKEQKKIYVKIGELAKLRNPLSHPQVLPLTGLLKGKWKLKLGNFRVVFTINNKRKIIEVELVDRRTEDTYKKIIRHLKSK